MTTCRVDEPNREGPLVWARRADDGSRWFAGVLARLLAHRARRAAAVRSTACAASVPTARRMRYEDFERRGSSLGDLLGGRVYPLVPTPRLPRSR